MTSFLFNQLSGPVLIPMLGRQNIWIMVGVSMSTLKNLFFLYIYLGNVHIYLHYTVHTYFLLWMQEVHERQHHDWFKFNLNRHIKN